MPRGEPTRTVRLPVWLLAQLAEQAGGIEGVPALITRRLAPQQRSLTSAPGAPRCECKNPVLSKHASNICTGCGRVRG